MFAGAKYDPGLNELRCTALPLVFLQVTKCIGITYCDLDLSLMPPVQPLLHKLFGVTIQRLTSLRNNFEHEQDEYCTASAPTHDQDRAQEVRV
jgi:hypothetical protein